MNTSLLSVLFIALVLISLELKQYQESQIFKDKLLLAILILIIFCISVIFLIPSE